MSEYSDLYFALLRITAAQALRAAGLTTCRPSVLDAFTDIAARYLMLLATTTRDFHESRGSIEPTVSDVRATLEHVGLVRPLNLFNDPYGNDTRGVDELIAWFKGPQAAEMRRVAGVGKEGEIDITAGVGLALTTVTSNGSGSGVGTGVGVGTLNNMPTVLLVGAKDNSAKGTAVLGVGDGQVHPRIQAPMQMPMVEESLKEESPVRWFNDLKGKSERLRGTALGPPMDTCRPVIIEGGMATLDLVKPQQEYHELEEPEEQGLEEQGLEEQEEEDSPEDELLIKEESRSNSESLSPPPPDMDLSPTPPAALVLATEEITQES